ncbi:hypothetical protein GCM10023231_18750 [Olivibacter ginsenosidimutans]|uniref:ABC transporter permease n=1 Tax=Olivibacter ginsenosidimutans TaxID=1176537 RepID=A0ABP9B7I7_9SPHI
MVFAKVLIKCFGREFYRINAGFLSASIILIIGYGLFIKSAGHVPEGQSLTINLILLIHFLQTPAITLVVCLLWLLYTIKCWRYMWKTSKRHDQLFWRYSATSIAYTRQLIAWTLFQTYLFIPLLFYWMVVLLYGLYTQHYEAPFYSGIYLLLLTWGSALLYLYRFNSLTFDQARFMLQWTRVFKQWPKPPWSLFLLELLCHGKLNLMVTKGISLALIIAFYTLFYDVDQPTRTAALIVLSISIAHAVLVYRDQLFTEHHLYFFHQFPYRPIFMYLQRWITYTILLLPELIWCIFHFQFGTTTLLIALSISSLLLIRSLADIIGQHMRRYLQWVFIVFFLSIFFLLYDASWLLIGINMVIAVLTYLGNYYNRETLSIVK